MKPKGLFDFIRRTSFTRFFVAWILLMFAFGILYWLLSLIAPLDINGESLRFTFAGIFHGIYGSFLIATIIGLGSISHLGFLSAIIYIQLAASIILILILADKIIQKYIHPHYHATHHQDRKIHHLMLMMSIFRNDAEKMMHQHGKGKKISIKDIESVIDGLYVAFVDAEKTVSSRNPQRHRIKTLQHVMLLENIESSLQGLQKLISYLSKNDVEWKDRSTGFWVRYIIETARNITVHIDTAKSPRLAIAVENIRDCAEKIESRL